MKNKSLAFINFLFIISGSFLLAFGVVGFLSPNNIATGGTAGLAIVLHHLINWPIGVLMFVINIPLLLVSIKYLGKKFAINTVICIGAISLFVEVLAEFAGLPNLSNNLLLATLYGGVCVGIGLGFVFKGGASAGGGTILAKIITANTDFKTSTVIFVLDTAVIVSAGIVFRSVELALWSTISIYAASKLIDMVLVGAPNQKIVHISSSKNLNELSKQISDNLGISGTIVKGDDLGATEHKDIIFIMIDKNKLNSLKQLVFEYDENVKMIVMEAVEVLGKENRGK